MKIKVLSYNIHKGFNGLGTEFVLHHLRDALRETQADILFLQEVVGENVHHQRKIKEWPTLPQFEFLADTVWPHHSYGRNAVFAGRHHGNAILSQFPIVQIYNLNISVHRYEQRGLLHCQVEIPEMGKTLDLFNTHIDLLSSSRRKQTNKISEYIQSAIKNHHSFLMAGDFNDWPQELCSIIEKNTQAAEAFTRLHGRPAKSYPHFFPILSLDRIYFRGMAPISAEVLKHRPWNRLSDHLPLLAEFDFL
jgi:endonuclease/exonuclease/phosphatase family metal-dependent hydrolase